MRQRFVELFILSFIICVLLASCFPNDSTNAQIDATVTKTIASLPSQDNGITPMPTLELTRTSFQTPTKISTSPTDSGIDIEKSDALNYFISRRMFDENFDKDNSVLDNYVNDISAFVQNQKIIFIVDKVIENQDELYGLFQELFLVGLVHSTNAEHTFVWDIESIHVLFLLSESKYFDVFMNKEGINNFMGNHETIWNLVQSDSEVTVEQVLSNEKPIMTKDDSSIIQMGNLKLRMPPGWCKGNEIAITSVCRYSGLPVEDIYIENMGSDYRGERDVISAYVNYFESKGYRVLDFRFLNETPYAGNEKVIMAQTELLFTDENQETFKIYYTMASFGHFGEYYLLRASPLYVDQDPDLSYTLNTLIGVLESITFVDSN